MNPPTSWLVPILGAATSSTLAALALKGALLLAAGAATSALLRKQSAAVRHFAWMLAIGGTLALAVVAPVAPRIALPLPVAGPFVPEPPLIGSPTTAPAGDPAVSRSRLAATSTSARTSGLAAAHVANRWPTAVRWNATTVWLAGCAAVLLWSLIGHIGLARAARAAAPVEAEGSEWSAMLRSAQMAQGVERSVRLARSRAIGAPVTWGWLHPTILVPADADSWPVERRRVALQHELAHVARGDYLTQLIATIACALQWFNPLVWLAARRLRTESEHACDDLVLMKGTPAADYASHLLEVARGSWNFRLGGFVAVSMARPSHLEGRLLALLDDARSRQAPRIRSRVMAAAMAAAVVVPIAGLRPSSGVYSPSQTTNSALDVGPERLSARVDGTATLVQTHAISSLTASIGRPVTAGSSRPESSLDSTFERRVEASPGGTLVLDLDTGASVRIRGGDDHEVTLHARLAGEDWRDSRVALERDGSDVRVTSRYVGRETSHSSSNAFEIRVPRRYNVRVNSAGGDLNIADVEGSFSGQTGGGGFVLEHLTGRASLSTGGGDIEVTDSDLQGRVSTGGGVVRLSRVRGGLRGSSGSGPVIYVEDEVTRTRRNSDRDSSAEPIYIIDGVPVTADRARERSDEAGRGRSRDRSADAGRGEGSGRGRSSDAGDLGDVRIRGSGSRIENGGSVRGSLSITKSGGEINLDDAPFGATVYTGGGRVRITKGAGMIDASTGGGDIDIGPIAGSVSAGTGAGDVHITLIKANGARQDIEVTSGSGRVEIELPANIDARFELESAFTENFRRQTRIDSDFELNQEVTREWDDSQGTPRRYVRARGTVGNGRGLISVRTVNGDVVVRRTR